MLKLVATTHIHASCAEDKAVVSHLKILPTFDRITPLLCWLDQHGNASFAMGNGWRSMLHRLPESPTGGSTPTTEKHAAVTWTLGCPATNRRPYSACELPENTSIDAGGQGGSESWNYANRDQCLKKLLIVPLTCCYFVRHSTFEDQCCCNRET